MVEVVGQNAARTTDISVRVGMKNPPADGTGGDVEFTQNKLCGIFIGPGQSGATSIVNCDGKSQGFGRLEFFRCNDGAEVRSE